ncbi:hypothetical protein KIPB_001082, partial [Kipferlia bialata]|eukprot:g1082.t1
MKGLAPCATTILLSDTNPVLLPDVGFLADTLSGGILPCLLQASGLLASPLASSGLGTLHPVPSCSGSQLIEGSGCAAGDSQLAIQPADPFESVSKPRASKQRKKRRSSLPSRVRRQYHRIENFCVSDLERAVAHCYAEGLLSINVFNKPAFQRMLNAVRNTPKEEDMPGGSAVRDMVIKVAKLETKELARSAYNECVNFATDGWKDTVGLKKVKKNSLCIIFGGKSHYLATVGENVKNSKEYLAEYLKKKIEELHNEGVMVGSVVCDNASNGVGAVKILRERLGYRHILRIACAAHSIQLVITDIIDEEHGVFMEAKATVQLL